MPFQRHKRTPESVLAKCRDMVALGLYEDAWDRASEFLSSKKRGWRSAHDALMLVFVDLCVQLRKSPQDGFIQYRMICSTNHLDSLKTCLQVLMEKAQEKGDNEYRELLARYKDKDMEDPVVRTEFNKEQFAQPYLKYQWSVYKAVLQVLRNNQKLDPVYQDTVRRAVAYCVRLKRTNEFRRLCDLNRKHLTAIFGHQNQTNKVEIHTAQMLGIYLNTRFELLENATRLEMWQEAFRLITDIHQLKEKSKTALDPALETNYYKKLTQIFLEADNMLLHAYAILRYYSLSRDAFDTNSDKKPRKSADGLPYEKLTEAEIEQLGKACVLATLSSPIPRSRSQRMGPPMTSEDRKNKNMAEKLHFYSRPNRDNLMQQLHYEDLTTLYDGDDKDYSSDHLFRSAMDDDSTSDALQDSQSPDWDFKHLEQLLIKDTSPLSLCQDVGKCMKRIIEQNPAPQDKKIYNLANYKKSIEKAAVRKLLLSVSKMYSTIKIERLQKMFFEDWNQRQIEDLIIEMVDKKFLWCRMSHKEGMCYFRAPDRLERNRFMQTYLSNLGHRMNTLYMKELARKDHTQTRRALFDDVRDGVQGDQNILGRRVKRIGKLRHNSEEMQKILRIKARQQSRMERYMEKDKVRRDTEQLQKMKQKQKAERDRLEQEEKRAREAQLMAKRQIQKVQQAVSEDVQKLAQSSGAKLDLLIKGNQGESELMDSKAVEKLTVDYLSNIKEAQEVKRQTELRAFDYSVRAERLEEIPLLHAQYRKEADKVGEEMMERYQEEVQRKRTEHEMNMKLKKLAATTRGHTNFFLRRFEERREEEYQRAKRIQDQNKSEHEARQRERKKAQREKRESQMRTIKLQRLKEMQSKQAATTKPPAAAGPPVAASPRAAPPVAQSPRQPQVPRQTSLRNEQPPMRPAAPARPPQPVRPAQQLPPPRKEPLNLPTPRTERPSQPQATGSESNQWRREAPKRRERRFINTKKKAEPMNSNMESEAGAPAKPPPVRGGLRQSPRNPSGGVAGSVRPTGPPSIRPAGPGPRSVRPQRPQSVRPTGPAGPIRPQNVRPTGPQSVRPAAPASVRPQRMAPQQVRPRAPAGGAQSVRPMAPASRAPMRGRMGDAGSPRDGDAGSPRTNSRFRRPARESAGAPVRAGTTGSWRDRQALRDSGAIDPNRRLRDRGNERVLSRNNRERRFFNSKGDE